LCEQLFMLPKDHAPKEAAAELWAALKDHLRENHPGAHLELMFGSSSPNLRPYNQRLATTLRELSRVWSANRKRNAMARMRQVDPARARGKG
ncbi:MAG: hypothetical protein ACRD3T_08935, partial [Terriglobia bacterium]